LERKTRHDYYYYNKEELLKAPRIPLIVMEDNATVFKSMAEEMVEEIKRKNTLGENTVFICPVGSVRQYPYFVDMVNEQNIILKNVWFINMDEYLTDDKEWIDKADKLSFRGFMDRTGYTKIKPELVMPEEQRIFPDPKNLTHIQDTIEKLGGVDICFGGIGINGHVTFNEASDTMTPDEFLAQHTRVLELSKETRAMNSIGNLNGALDDMPHYCITIGINEIAHARKIRLGCFRDWHRSVVRHAAYGEKTAHFPVSLLQDHPDINIKFTEFVANLSE
jgi:glucosamine-6-phosphate deaminase